MNMQKLVFDSVLKEINPNDRTITALISTAAIDRMDEVLDPEGADLKNFRKNPVVLWAHTYDMPPIGKAIWIKNNKDGILSKVKFAPTAFADEIFELFKEGFLKAFSVGFLPRKWETPETKGDKKQPRRVYTDWELLEYSAVPVPANPEALALAIQKGILQDKVLIKSFGLDKKEPVAPLIPPEAPPVQDDAIIEQKGQIELIDMLEAELAQMKAVNEQETARYEEIVKTLNDEITTLKYRVYVLGSTLLELRQAPKEPEITSKTIAEMVSAEVAGVIRRLTGKVS